MPYSIETKFRKSMMKKAEKIWKKRERDITKAVDQADLATLKELQKEAKNMYKQLIDDYYAYKTIKYVRHGQDRPGTCIGENLYRADFIHIKNNELFIETNYKQMKAGYRDHGREYVLNMIRDGERYNVGDWTGDFEGEYIAMYDTYINKAFKEFEHNFQSMYDDIFENKLKKLKGTFEYW